jgi:pimeloyl-ACP methyl ester carboxylesterase
MRALLAIACFLLAGPALAAGEYAPINGLRMYYEVQGSGRPLVLLHGGVCTIEVCIDKVRAPFVKSRRTIAVEQQGHGRTADIDRPLSYEQMAEDTAALLRQLKVKDADFFGYSMGGSIALRIALRHPELVRKVAIFGAGYSNEGMVPGLVDSFKTLKAEDIPQQFRDAYAKTAPDKSKWPVLVNKITRLVLDAKDLTAADLKSIQAPTLVMTADGDIIRTEHAVEMYRLLPKGQLAVLPVADHFAPMQRPAWIVSMLRTFYEKK